jgi:serine-type D-Ala-D-Ala carboxypeptidase/endopeptidase
VPSQLRIGYAYPSMQFSRRNQLLSLLLLLLICLSRDGISQAIPARLATSNEIHDMLVERIDVQHKTDAIVVGVITRKAREIISYGHFDATDPRVPDGDTLFEIGSITKPFTALLLSEMVLRGEVKLSDPIAKYLPDGVHAPTWSGKPITLVDLGTHTSGLPSLPTNFTQGYSVHQMYEFLNTYQLNRDPGKKYEYSNYGYGLLGQLLARRAGTDYETLLRTRITEPLGMSRTAIHLTPELQHDFIPGHFMTLRNGGKKASEWQVPALESAGGIRSTANDMLIFLAANLGIIHSPLQPAMKNMLKVQRPVSAGVKVGLGWNVDDGRRGVVFHAGLTNGYFSFAAFDPHRKVGVIVLSNSNALLDDLGWRILDFPSPLVEQQIGPSNMPR